MKTVHKTIALTTFSLLGGASPLCASQAATERSPQSTQRLTVIKVCAKSTDATSSSSYRASISSTTSPGDLETARKINALKKALEKNACQQYIDSATESELKEQEQRAQVDGNIAFALAERYARAKQREELEKASQLYLLAANLDNSDAQWHLANEYLTADTLSRAKSMTAFTYLKACAPKGFPEAYIRIAYMYEKGIGVTADEEIAKKYMAKAEQQIGLEAAIQAYDHLRQTEDAKQYKKELAELEKDKNECKTKFVKCPNKQCLFQGHEWFFQYRPSYSCPKQITSGQPVYHCLKCGQAFHMDCIAHWRKQWNITRTKGCPNPNCDKLPKSPLSQEEQKKQQASLLAGTAS